MKIAATIRARAEARRTRSSAPTASGTIAAATRAAVAASGPTMSRRADPKTAYARSGTIDAYRPDLGRQPGDLGVADAERHDECGDRDPADGVRAQQRSMIAAQRPRERLPAARQSVGDPLADGDESMVHRATDPRAGFVRRWSEAPSRQASVAWPARGHATDVDSPARAAGSGDPSGMPLASSQRRIWR